MKDKLYNMIVEKEDELYSDDPCMCDSERIEAVVDHLVDSGAVIVLPCKVGDTVYIIGSFTGQLMEDKVCGIETNNTGIVLVLDCGFVVFVEQQLGKTVFLTKEEAEAKLAELKGE